MLRTAMPACFRLLAPSTLTLAAFTPSLLCAQNLRDAAAWLGYSYLYVRMLRAPGLYGVPIG